MFLFQTLSASKIGPFARVVNVEKMQHEIWLEENASRGCWSAKSAPGESCSPELEKLGDLARSVVVTYTTSFFLLSVSCTTSAIVRSTMRTLSLLLTENPDGIPASTCTSMSKVLAPEAEMRSAKTAMQLMCAC
jgi:hypothetical protein